MAEDHSLNSIGNLIEQLRNGSAKFEVVSSPVASIVPRATSINNNTSFPLFARIGFGAPLGNRSPALKKVERYSVQRVTGDGRCMFRALVKGMAINKGINLNSRAERDDADELRFAVKEVLCDNSNERKQYEEALIAITVDESLKRYCQRIQRPDFWGGESELLVLSKLCKQPIIVYIPEHEAVYLLTVIFLLFIESQHAKGGMGSGFIPIAEYGAQFRKGPSKGKPKKVVRLLYSGRNHYDLLV
ncbi:hypothetical protein ACFE04_011698 [Oxalis oulophora]